MKLKYWFRWALQNTLTILGASLAYAVMMSLMLPEGSVVETIRTMPVITLLFGGFMQMAFNFSVFKLPVNLTLSFGSTRRDVFVGMIIYTLLPSALITLCLSPFALALGGIDFSRLFSTVLPLVAAFFLSLTAMGLLSAILSWRFSDTVAAVSTIATILVSVVAGVFLVLHARSHGSQLLALVLHPFTPWLALLATAVIYGAMMLMIRRILRRYAVTA